MDAFSFSTIARIRSRAKRPIYRSGKLERIRTNSRN
jgi:hypothetical protein